MLTDWLPQYTSTQSNMFTFTHFLKEPFFLSPHCCAFLKIIYIFIFLSIQLRFETEVPPCFSFYPRPKGGSAGGGENTILQSCISVSHLPSTFFSSITESFRLILCDFFACFSILSSSLTFLPLSSPSIEIKWAAKMCHGISKSCLPKVLHFLLICKAGQ